MRYVVTGYDGRGARVFQVTVTGSDKEAACRRARSHMGSAAHGTGLLKQTTRLDARPVSVPNCDVNWKAMATVVVVLAVLAFGGPYGWAMAAVIAGGAWLVHKQSERAREAQHRKQEQLKEEAQRQGQQSERARQAERERQEELKREARRREEQAERVRHAEKQRQAEQERCRRAEEERQRSRGYQRDHGRADAQSEGAWWSILDVAPSATKDEIVRKYRSKILQCHPDRVAALDPAFTRLAEERTKTLNAAYAQAMNARRE